MKIQQLLLVLLIVTLPIYSQKSSPIAGHSASLIDLLEKDYATSEATLDLKPLIEDQRTVIKIFKNYLTDKKLDFEKDIDTDVCSTVKEVIKNFRCDSALDYNKINFYITNKTLKLEEEKLKLEQIKKIDTTNSIEFDSIIQLEKELEALKTTKNIIELEAIKNAFSANEYLYYTIDKFITKHNEILTKGSDLYTSINNNASIQKSIPFIGGSLTFETLIDGLSKFLVERIKQELSTYVVENIQSKLKNPKPTSILNELIVLLPKTVEFMNEFDADELLNFTNDLKQHIEEDLNNLLENAYLLKDTPRFNNLIKKNPDLALAFEALKIYPEFSKLENPVDFFDILTQNEVLMDWGRNSDSDIRKNITNSIKFINLLAHSLTIVENGELRFVTTKFMSSYGSKLDFFIFYFGFLHQQDINYYTIKFGTTENLFQLWKNDRFKPDSLKSSSEQVKKLHTLLASIVKNAEKIYQEAKTIKAINKDDSKKLTPEQTRDFVATFIDFIQQTKTSGQSILKEINTNNTIELNKVDNYINAAKSVNEIVFDLQKKKYARAITKTIELPSKLSTNDAFISNYSETANKIKNIHLLSLLRSLNNDYNSFKEKDQNNLKLIVVSIDDLLKNIDVNNENPKIKKIKDKFTDLNNHLLEGKEIKLIRTDLDFVKTELKNSATELIDSILKHQKIKLSVEQKLIKNFKLTPLVAKTIDATFKNFLLAKAQDYILKTSISEKELNNLQTLIKVHLPTIAANSIRIKDKNALKIISFIGDVANSENSDDVRNALNAYALPTGSYKIKRKSRLNFAINSYPGLIYGWETNALSKHSGGITAPVGVSIKLFNWDGFINGVHAFIPIIDIAAPVKFRFNNPDNPIDPNNPNSENNTVKSTSEYTFKNIFSPGFYLSLPINKTPFAINLGTQYGPELNFENNDLVTSKQRESWSFNVAFVIDIPIFNLYNQPKK